MNNCKAQDQKDGPLVVAYIGQDDPLRGDSKGAIGVAQNAARMLNGRYDYVDALSLSQRFNQFSGYDAQLSAYAQQIKRADIVIGHQSWLLCDQLVTPPVVQEDRWNEKYSEYRTNNTQGLVAHDLTDAALQYAGREFQSAVKNIKGDLVAVFMGGVTSCDQDAIAHKLAAMAATGGRDTTFYLCPSRRTGYLHARLKSNLETLAKYTPVKLQVMGDDYPLLVNGYNPYMGLLDHADHLVLIGESGSMISEALYTKKPLYLTNSPYLVQELTDHGHILGLLEEAQRVFKKSAMPRVDITAEVARSIADEYLDLCAAPPQP